MHSFEAKNGNIPSFFKLIRKSHLHMDLKDSIGFMYCDWMSLLAATKTRCCRVLIQSPPFSRIVIGASQGKIHSTLKEDARTNKLGI